MLKKRGLVVFSLLIIGLFIISCAPANQASNVPIGQQVMNTISHIGTLKFLGVTSGGNALVGFVRVLVAIMVFAILFESGRFFLNQNIAAAAAGVLAVISAIFMPANILAGVGGAYATLTAFVLIGIPVVGGLFVVFQVIPSTTRFWLGLRTLLIILLIWILSNVKTHAKAIIT